MTQAAIITGGGRGLGQAMALGLAREGWSVLITAAREQAEIEAVAALGKGRIVPMRADVTRVEECERAVAAALDRFGRLDLLVNNAGRGMRCANERFFSEPTRFWTIGPETYRMVIDTNVTGPFLMARAAVAPMLQAGRGRIVNISMNHATMRRAGFSPYGPSKAALESETIIWAQDLAGTGITVNALLPGGATATGMIPDSVPEEARTRLLDPAIIVPPLLWLASPAADDITGRRLVATRFSPASPASALDDAGWARED